MALTEIGLVKNKRTWLLCSIHLGPAIERSNPPLNRSWKQIKIHHDETWGNSKFKKWKPLKDIKTKGKVVNS